MGQSYPINHKNYNFLDRDWFTELLFFTNSLAKLSLNSLLSNSSTSQLHSKLQFKSTNHIQSRTYARTRALAVVFLAHNYQ